MTNITVTCVDLAVRYRVQPRYGAMLAKMDYKAKLEEEEGRLSLHQGEPQDGGRALRVHPLMLGWSVGGIVSIDTLTRVHRLAFSPALCCPASRALARRSPLTTPTRDPQEVRLVSRVARSCRPAAPCGLHPATQRRQACTSADERPGCAAQKASWEELEALKAPVCLLPAS